MCNVSSVLAEIRRKPNHLESDGMEACMPTMTDEGMGHIKDDYRNEDNLKRNSNFFPAIMMNGSLQNEIDDPLIVLGMNLTPLHPKLQFYVCAGGVFGFTIVYAYLQELLSVHIMGRNYALFLTSCQLAGYSFWSFLLMKVSKYRKEEIRQKRIRQINIEDESAKKDSEKNIVIDDDADDADDADDEDERVSDEKKDQTQYQSQTIDSDEACQNLETLKPLTSDESTLGKGHGSVMQSSDTGPPFQVYVALSLLRAIDIGLTNGAMKFLNYPAKTLIKSTRVAFTMLTGLIVGKKRYKIIDYVMVSMLVFGLSIFLRADFRTKAVFHPIGVVMLLLSLCCDGLFNNYSELIMKKYRISQDHYQSSIYSVAFIFVLIATIAKGEFMSGFRNFFLQHGTMGEIEENKIGLHHDHREIPTYTRNTKLLIFFLFTFTGLFGSSCAGAITKRFGALRMSVTSTTRKAGTLFISLAAPGFHNKCTQEHILGMVIFMSALFVKSFSQQKANSLKKNDETKRLISKSPTPPEEKV